MTHHETKNHQNKHKSFPQIELSSQTHIPEYETYCCVFSSSPYSQPSFSSWMSKAMMSPSSKLRSVLLLPAVWGKMVLTRGFLPTLRPDDWDVDRDRLTSPRLPWSGDSRG